VLGAWQNGLIIEHQGQVRSADESQLHHNLYPVGAVLVKGEPLRVISRRMDMKGRSLRWLVENLKANHDYYLLDELYTDADKIVNVSQIETYHPVIWNGSKIQLHYARAEDLRVYLNLAAIRDEVLVQFWLKPGDSLVELSFSGGEKTPTPSMLDEMF
jgi:inner membrane protein